LLVAGGKFVDRRGLTSLLSAALEREPLDAHHAACVIPTQVERK
jgi:hypothetical protein